jgi:RNA polymerase sigma factor (sigma-70 family)
MVTKKDIENYNSWLELFQEDLAKIIGKYRYKNHIMTHEELVSEINMDLIKKRDSIIEYNKREREFNQNNFKISAFVHARNLIKWSHQIKSNKSYVKRRVDGSVYNEDGEMISVYENIINTTGIDDDFEFDKKDKHESLLKIIKEYSSILNSKEKKVFELLEKGLTREEVAKQMGLTHQRISQYFSDIKANVRSYFNGATLKDESYDKVSQGKIAIKNFFEKPHIFIKKEDKELIKKTLYLNPNTFSPKEINRRLFSNKFETKQVASCIIKNKLSWLIKKPRDIKKATRMLKKGASCIDVAKITKVPLKSVRSIKGHLTRKKTKRN